MTATSDTYRVVLLDGGGQAAGWLSPSGRHVVGAAWEAGEWSYRDAKRAADRANRDKRFTLPAWCKWHPVPVLLEVAS